MNDNCIIVIPVTINGKTFQFAYDTGADKTVMSYRATKRLNISNIERRPCNPMRHDTAALRIRPVLPIWIYISKEQKYPIAKYIWINTA